MLAKTMKHVRTVGGDAADLQRVAWSPDAQRLVAGTSSSELWLWDVEGGPRQEFYGAAHDACLAWSPTADVLATGNREGTVALWSVATSTPGRIWSWHSGLVANIAWSPDGQAIASASLDGTSVVWDVSGNRHKVRHEHAGPIRGVAWSPSGTVVATCGDDGTVVLWDREVDADARLSGHAGPISDVSWSHDGRLLATASEDRTVRIWDRSSGRTARILEGHTAPVLVVAFASGDDVLASCSIDGTIQLWRTDTWEPFATLACEEWGGIAFHPDGRQLACVRRGGDAIEIWDVQPIDAAGAATAHTSHYTNAKVVLVGDTSVGKSALALVLLGHQFEPTESTHGRQVWTLDTHVVEVAAATETREIMLWDLAGQQGYRLIHQLQLNEVALALIVFDARSETDPFAGVRYWSRALRQARRAERGVQMPLGTLLVAARADRGGLAVSKERVEALRHEVGAAAYLETSAKEGWSIAELGIQIRELVDWAALPKVTSSEIFQTLQRFLIERKAEGRLLLTVDELCRAFAAASGLDDTPALREQLETCIGRVDAAGLIRRLSFGSLVLLQPEVLDSYAAAIVNAARDEPDGMGSIREAIADHGRFRMAASQRVEDKDAERLLLIATIEDLLRHEIALREPADGGPYLIFPSQLTRESPDLPEPEGRTSVFTFEGPVLNVYATLSVRLSHSGVFTRHEWWKNATTYHAVAGRCGIIIREIEEGKGELTLFFSDDASDETRIVFGVSSSFGGESVARSGGCPALIAA
jgi:small GTP-binding protein